MADLPQTVAGATLNDHDTTVATWGDPHIVLRCGVDKPAGLQPTSPCDVVNDVGWFSEQIDDGWRFTTIGRAGNIEVTVPTSYAPQADALVDLSAAIKKMPQVASEIHPDQRRPRGLSKANSMSSLTIWAYVMPLACHISGNPELRVNPGMVLGSFT